MLMYINYMPGEARPTEEPLSGGKKMKQRSSNAKIASTPRKRGGKSSATAAILPRRLLLSQYFFVRVLWQQVFQSVCRHSYDLYVPHILVICGASTRGFRFQTTCSSVGQLQPVSAPPHPCVESGEGGGDGECYTMPCGAEFTWSFTASVAGVAGVYGATMI